VSGCEQCLGDGWDCDDCEANTVCVRLDGLADKIAVVMHSALNRCSHDALGDDCRYLATDVVALLQSLAVQ
jgi:hypothetical protein